jgi:hypothetical protein
MRSQPTLTCSPPSRAGTEMTLTRPKFKPSQIVVCCESFGSNATGTPTVITSGTRLRGDHALVRAVPSAFLPDGASAEEIHAARVEIWHDAEAGSTAAPAETTRLEGYVPDTDAVVAVRNVNMQARGATTTDGHPLSCLEGYRCHRRARIAKENPADFAPVATAKVPRARAMRSLARLTERLEDGSPGYDIPAGVWVDRGHAAVTTHPSLFEPVGPED